jgi:hypothetical protein
MPFIKATHSAVIPKNKSIFLIFSGYPIQIMHLNNWSSTHSQDILPKILALIAAPVVMGLLVNGKGVSILKQVNIFFNYKTIRCYNDESIKWPNIC